MEPRWVLCDRWRVLCIGGTAPAVVDDGYGWNHIRADVVVLKSVYVRASPNYKFGRRCLGGGRWRERLNIAALPGCVSCGGRKTSVYIRWRWRSAPRASLVRCVSNPPYGPPLLPARSPFIAILPNNAVRAAAHGGPAPCFTATSRKKVCGFAAHQIIRRKIPRRIPFFRDIAFIFIITSVHCARADEVIGPYGVFCECGGRRGRDGRPWAADPTGHCALIGG